MQGIHLTEPKNSTDRKNQGSTAVCPLYVPHIATTSVITTIPLLDYLNRTFKKKKTKIEDSVAETGFFPQKTDPVPKYLCPLSVFSETGTMDDHAHAQCSYV